MVDLLEVCKAYQKYRSDTQITKTLLVNRKKDLLHCNYILEYYY